MCICCTSPPPAVGRSNLECPDREIAPPVTVVAPSGGVDCHVAITRKANWRARISASDEDIADADENQDDDQSDVSAPSPSCIGKSKKQKQKKKQRKVARWCAQFDTVRLIEVAKCTAAIPHFHNAYDVRTGNARLSALDPSAPNRPAFDGDTLKQRFTALRTAYTTAMANFNQSGQHNGQPAEEADEFFFNFVRENPISLYQFLAWRGQALQYISRPREEGADVHGKRASKSQESKRRLASPDELVQRISALATPPSAKRRREERGEKDSQSLSSIAQAPQAESNTMQELVLARKQSNMIRLLDCPSLTDTDKEKIRKAIMEQL